MNAVVADPDGNNHLPISLNTGLMGHWDSERVTVSGANHRIADMAGGDQPLDCRQLSMTLDHSGMISKAALFDGGNDHLAAPGTLFNNLSAFSTTLWFKTTPNYVQNKAGTIHTVFFACNGSLDAFPELIISIYKGIPGSTTQKITVSRYNGTTVTMTFFGEVPATAYVDDGRWHHLAYVKNGNNNRLFIDGVKIKESNTTNGTLSSTSAGYLCFGKNVPVAADQGHTFRGSMDRMRFYNRAITDAEVTALYSQDSDRDGYSDLVEKQWTGTPALSPFLSQSPEGDTDGDGLPDGWETANGLNPLSAAGTHGRDADPDRDGIPNWIEFVLGLNPLRAQTFPGMNDITLDRDSDGIPDVWEAQFASILTDPTTGRISVTRLLDWQLADSSRDLDSDGLTNLQEYQFRSNPSLRDSDGDLLPDLWETTFGLNPNSAHGIHGKDGDFDADGLTNFDELIYGTQPNKSDTDNDTTSDGAEVSAGGNPNDAADGGKAPAPEEKMTVQIIVGDPSGSASERWTVRVRDLSTGKVIITHQAPEFGKLSEPDKSTYDIFRKNRGYEFELVHEATDPERLAQDPGFYPDYDWALEIKIMSEDGTFIDITDTNFSSHLVIDPWDTTSQTRSDTISLLVNRSEPGNPWDRAPDRTAQYQQQIVPKRVLLLPVEFEIFVKDESCEIGGDRSPNWKAHELNMDTRQEEEEHYGDFKKCVAHKWSVSSLNMAKYLKGYNDHKDLFEDPEILHWKVWKGDDSEGAIQESYNLDLNTIPRLGDRPALDRIREYRIAPVVKGTTEPLDRLIVTVIPSQTLESYDEWKVENSADLSWLDDLAPSYAKLPEPVTVTIEADPANGLFNDVVTHSEQSPDDDCDWSPWKVPGAQDSYYHPDSYFEVRTEVLEGMLFSNAPAHHACYNENRFLILPVVNGDLISPGSADRVAAFTSGGTPSGHLNADVKPFIWALQIDGNPAVGVDLNTALSDPIMFQGVELKAYARLRPAIVPAGIIPLGTCPVKTF